RRCPGPRHADHPITHHLLGEGTDMPESWNPWKATAIGMALVMATALITGLVVANWYGPQDAKKTEATVKTPASKLAAVEATPPTRTERPSATPPATAPTAGVPTQSAIAACNQHAARQVNARDKTVDTVKDAGVGALAGAAVGAAAGAIAGGGKG